ncbi:MAG TPA: hypothetical protein VKZ65_07270 [Glycomyces sp.]|nr:hypothetical protein [Glycomyces sp.]
MRDALRYEWTRLTTLRSTYWLIGVGLLCSALIAVIFGLAAGDDPLDPEILSASINGGAAFGIPFLAVFMAIIGIFSTGHEWRHGTIQPTLTALPQRSRLIAAKIAVVAAATLAVTLVSILLNLGVVLAFWGEAPGLFEEPLSAALLGYVVYTLIYMLTGLGLGLLFRGVPSALVVIFLMPLILESLIVGLAMLPALDWLEPLVKFLPFTAGSLLMTVGPVDLGMGADFGFFGRWGSGGVFAAFAAVIVGCGWYLFKRRDA